VKCIENGEETLSWHRENAIAALDLQLVDEDPAAGALGHGRRVSPNLLLRHPVALGTIC
jgi:hypothetical protein